MSHISLRLCSLHHNGIRLVAQKYCSDGRSSHMNAALNVCDADCRCSLLYRLFKENSQLKVK